ncbi:MAG TPA: hypothetical protein VL400_18870 [Polyangiaceae bacterium]|jgi:hypothetical protein|nr:hypothetical protein [Polyangiaceae bacterium]
MIDSRTVLVAAAIALATVFSMGGCGASACDQITQKYADCSGNADVTDGQSADCNDAEEACAQCYLDSKKDICTELLDIQIECADACSVGV